MEFQIAPQQREMIASVRQLAQTDFKPNAHRWMDGTFPWENMQALAKLGVFEIQKISLVEFTYFQDRFGAEKQTDPGTNIQLEIFNLGPWDIKLEAGMRICQLILEEVREVPTTGYSGQFNKQRAFTVPAAS